MAFVLDPAKSVPREVRRVVCERLAEAISILDDLGGADARSIELAVHNVRKRCKEVRAVARLVSPSIGKEFDRFNRDVRDAGDTLAPIRDAHAVLATFDDLQRASERQGDPDLSRVRAAQASAADEATLTVHGGDPRIARASALLIAARGRVRRWAFKNDFSSLAIGLEDAYRSGRKQLRRARAHPGSRRMHEWRKAVKDLWYQTRLLVSSAPSALEPLVASLDDLAEALGDDHDLAVLIERLNADPDQFGGKECIRLACHLARRQQDNLRHRTFRLGSTIFTETPAAFTKRLSAYWARTLRDGPERPTGGIAELAAEEHHRSPLSMATDTVSVVERERKFLVARLPALSDNGTELRQGYLALDGNVSVRVRDAGDKGCTLTVKAGSGAVRTELEFELHAEQFAAAWEQTRGRRIHKTRYRLKLDKHNPNGLVAELDVFHDDLNGLVLVEVEFDSEASMTAFTPPEWFGLEVTEDIAYTNAALSVHALEGPPTMQA